MPEVLLINPPETGMGKNISPPLGLLYLAGILRQNNIPVKIMDGCVYGWEGVRKELEGHKPSIIGVTCHTYGRAKALETARIARETNLNSLIVFGGTHPTVMFRQLLENYPFIDIAVIGEGEQTFLEICKGKSPKEIKGIAYREDNKVVISPERDIIKDLDTIAFPAWQLIDINKYSADGIGTYRGIDLGATPRIPVAFSRGCIGNCNFCSIRLMWKRWRHRSAKNMADEIEFLYKNLNVRHIFFSDDLLTADKKATLELCDEIISRKLDIVFDATTRTDCVNPEILKALKEAGCYKIAYGIESVSPKILKTMGKPIDVKATKDALKETKRAGVRTEVLLIAGSVGETKETINETIDFLNEVDPDAVGLANGLMIFPGTKIYDYAKKAGVIDDDFWLTDYNWKVYTYENSKIKLDMFCSAINRRKKLSKFELVNIIRYHRFYSRAAGDKMKRILSALGFRQEKRQLKYKVMWGA